MITSMSNPPLEDARMVPRRCRQRDTHTEGDVSRTESDM